MQTAVGVWTEDEHAQFLKGLELYGKNWERIKELIPTRSVCQVRTHAQKYFYKLEKENRKKILFGHTISEEERGRMILRRRKPVDYAKMSGEQQNNVNQVQNKKRKQEVKVPKEKDSSETDVQSTNSVDSVKQAVMPQQMQSGHILQSTIAPKPMYYPSPVSCSHPLQGAGYRLLTPSTVMPGASFPFHAVMPSGHMIPQSAYYVNPQGYYQQPVMAHQAAIPSPMQFMGVRHPAELLRTPQEYMNRPIYEQYAPMQMYSYPPAAEVADSSTPQSDLTSSPSARVVKNEKNEIREYQMLCTEEQK